MEKKILNSKRESKTYREFLKYGEEPFWNRARAIRRYEEHEKKLKAYRKRLDAGELTGIHEVTARMDLNTDFFVVPREIYLCMTNDFMRELYHKNQWYLSSIDGALIALKLKREGLQYE